MQDTYRIIPYEKKYADQTVQMWRDSKEAAIEQKEIHSFNSHLYFLNEILPKEFEIDIATLGEQVVGIIAYNKSEISQLYIHNDYQGKGIGKELLNRAKKNSSGSLSLYTFEINEKAQQFYARNGFKITARGHENEENLPDVRMEWKW
ncbi:ribosomal protein S18 acetylase RimI-like enzyme [Falsibacillus pallidus]|uniref:Ribosomal protein S18 acetylase RimI-like enzyme n=2 Tax=Falsibacillus pallidus TaxID=493781 RepID=A0A370GPH5_9BACI|nr:ribosomal protein S18 acetylase RimI-like enzyme [Falsibacillus pallidus]